MSTSFDRMGRRLRLAAIVIGPGSLCIGGGAHAETLAGVNVGAGATLESNPYLEEGNRSDIAASLDVSPWLQFSDPLTSVELSGAFQISRFSRDENGTNISGTARANVQHRMSPYVTISGGASYTTSRAGGVVGVVPGIPVFPGDPDVPVPPPPPLVPPLQPDVSLAGTRATTHAISVNAGAGVRLSTKDQLGISVSGTRSSNNLIGATDFNYISGGLSYSRTLSPHTSVSAAVSVGRSDYPGTDVGDGTIISPEVGVQTVLGKNTTASASIGASFSQTTQLNGLEERSTALSGRAQVCRTMRAGSLCLNAAQSVQPTAFGTISTVTTGSVTYDMRVSQRDSIGFNLGLNRVNNDADLASLSIPRSFRYYSAGTNWSHNFGRRLFGSVSAAYSRVDDTFRTTNGFTLSARLQVRFGAIS